MFVECWGKRLVACVSLLAYFLANTHANLVIGAYIEPTPVSATTKSTAPKDSEPATAPSEEPASECPHCAKRLKAKAARVAKQQQHAQSDTQQPAPDGKPVCASCDEACPCCPKTPACPCPGGCALCSVAKVPCLVADAPMPSSSVCVGDFLVEEAFSYLSPFSGGLIRPPRA
jgi:hypothetical protein